VHNETGDLRRVAEETFGWSQLHDEQLEAMEQVMAGHDLLAVLPTGAGKSAIYQVPALLLDGPTLVVSPLIALQHDQLEGIEDTRAPEAVAVNSAQRSGERKHAWQSVRQGDAEYLFLAPEQLAKDEVVDELAGWTCRCSWSTRRTASRPGGTTSGPTTFGSPRSSSGSAILA